MKAQATVALARHGRVAASMCVGTKFNVITLPLARTELTTINYNLIFLPRILSSVERMNEQQRDDEHNCAKKILRNGPSENEFRLIYEFRAMRLNGTCRCAKCIEMFEIHPHESITDFLLAHSFSGSMARFFSIMSDELTTHEPKGTQKTREKL